MTKYYKIQNKLLYMATFKGRTLIELVVAIAISIIILAMAFTVYVYSIKSEWLINSTAEINNRAISISNYLKNYIDIAGFSNIGSNANIPAIIKCENCSGNIGISGFTIAHYATKFNSYTSSSEPLDCIGNKIGAHAGIMSSSFFIKNNSLYCSSNSGNASLFYGIKEMKTWYGIGNPIQYYKPSESVNDMSEVTAVRLCFILQGDSELHNSSEVSKKYIDCSGAEKNNENGLMMKNYIFTFYLRNRL